MITNLKKANLKSKKNRLCILLVSLMNARSYHKYDLDKLINDSILNQYLQQPMYTTDHIRRAMVDNGYMTKDPLTEVYTLKQDIQSLQEKHNAIVQTLLLKIENAPDEKIDCAFSGNIAKPLAILNHYQKKYSYLDLLESLKKEFCHPYIH